MKLKSKHDSEMQSLVQKHSKVKTIYYNLFDKFAIILLKIKQQTKYFALMME